MISPLIVTAQSLDEKDFTLYTIREGLTDNRVTALAQDVFGYIWIATEKGLNRFDGNSFQSFYSDSSANSLPQDHILKLKWLDKEQLGVSTLTGLHIVNTRTLQTRNLIIPADSLKYEYRVNRIQDMSGDEDGNIFILTRSGFYQFNKQDELVFRYDYYRTAQVETETFVFGRNLAKVGNSTLLLSTIDGLYLYYSTSKKLHRLDKDQDAFYRQIAKPGDQFFFKHSDQASFSLQTEHAKETFYFDLLNKTRKEVKASFNMQEKFNWRSSLFKLNDTLFAITGREKGFYLVSYNKQSRDYDILPHPYFENYYCSFLLLGKDHRLWIGTNKGLFKENRSVGKLDKISLSGNISPFNADLNVRGMTIVGNRLFLATTGEGLLIFDQSTLKLLKKIDFRHEPASNNDALYVIALNKDTVLAGGLGSLYYINTQSLAHTDAALPDWNKELDWISSLYKDSRNTVFASKESYNQFYFKHAGQQKFTLARHPANPFFNILTPRYIVEDPDGNIWFSGHGTSRFNYQLQQFDLRIDSFPKIKTMQKQVLGLLFDASGKMYFGIPENGLIIYDPVQKKYEQFTRNNGLPDNTIPALFLHKNKLWLGTASGLASFDIATKQISSFGLRDNIPAGPFTGYSFYYDSSAQQLYGIFNNTLLRFNPDQLVKNNSPPDFFIESVEIADEKTLYHPPNKIELLYQENNLVVHLGAINFEDAYLQQFAYRFAETGTEAWHETGSQRNIIFSNLSPGRHLLQLKAFIKNNSWPEQTKEIEILIRPPFWQTPWFIGLATFTTLFVLYAFYRYRVRAIRQKANIDKQLAELEMKGLHSQMNPHFIFNSLNSIRQMILNNENKEASHYLSKFAHLIRITLDQSSESLVSLRDTQEYLDRYIEMERVRNNQFAYTVIIDNELDIDETLIPPMLIQPFIENALWHGVSPGKKDIDIRVEFKKEGNNLICIIDDNGIGINQSLKDKDESGIYHHPVGISNIRNRIALLNKKYKIECSINIKDKSKLSEAGQTGTLVILKLPLEIKQG